MSDTDAARRLAAAATLGPWVIERNGGIDVTGEGWYQVEIGFADPDDPGAGLMLGDHENVEADAEFIAAARTLVPELCDELDRLRAERSQVRADLETAEKLLGDALTIRMCADPWADWDTRCERFLRRAEREDVPE